MNRRRVLRRGFFNYDFVDTRTANARERRAVRRRLGVHVFVLSVRPVRIETTGRRAQGPHNHRRRVPGRNRAQGQCRRALALRDDVPTATPVPSTFGSFYVFAGSRVRITWTFLRLVNGMKTLNVNLRKRRRP